MSLWRDDPRPSGATLVALVAVSLVAVGSLSRLFVGPTYLAWALPAATIGSAFALYFGRRSLGLGFAFVAAGWALSFPGLFARTADGSAFPTLSGFRTAWRLMASGVSEAAKAVPPLESELRYMALVWTAFLFLGFLGASWVVVRRPVGAIISCLGIVTFSGSLGDGPGRTWFAVGTIAMTGAFFLSEGRQRIERWASGHVRVPGWLGVPTLGVACAIAVGAPFVLGDAPLVELRSAIRPRLVIIKPLSDIRRQLKVDPPLEVMRVVADRATYWRLTALDRYDGREWVLEARPRPIREGVAQPPEPPTTGDTLEQQYRLTSLLSPWMPAAYAARAIDTGASVDLDERSQTLLLRDDTTPGLAYTVSSQLPRITVNTTGPLRTATDPNERLLGDRARTIVTDARTPLEVARRLEAHFHAYTYNEDVDGGHTMQRLQRFLEQRIGYCEQFAATMTLMLRGLGIDARVGVGFLPGTQSQGEFVVSTREAHAWVEALIPGVGWTSFDPTPPRDGTSPSEPEPEETQLTTPPPPTQTGLPASTPEPQRQPDDITQPASAPFPAPVVWSMVAFAVLASIPITKRVRRRLRKTADPSRSIAGAYAELVDRARELGWSPRPSETQREFVGRAAGHTEHDRNGLDRLTARALYGPPGVTPDEARTAWTALSASIARMRRRAALWRRLVAPLDPRTLAPPGLFMRARLRLRTALARS